MRFRRVGIIFIFISSTSFLLARVIDRLKASMVNAAQIISFYYIAHTFLYTRVTDGSDCIADYKSNLKSCLAKKNHDAAVIIENGVVKKTFAYNVFKIDHC